MGKANKKKGLEKATSLEGVYKALSQKPLEIDELEEFYQKTDKARGERVRSRLSLVLKQNTDSYQHTLFVGYRGCGKSTELRHLTKDIQDDFLVLDFSIKNDLDPSNFNYIQLIILTMKKLFVLIDEKALGLEESYLSLITNFIKTKEVSEIRDKYMSADLKAGTEVKIDIPFITKFFTGLTATMRATKSFKTVLKEKIEPHFSTLLDRCNELIAQVKLKLDVLDKEDLLIIIEDLDKVHPSQAEELFFNYSNQITALQCNVIYTFPIALKYHDRFTAIKNCYSNTYELPMIKVNEKDGSSCEEGVDTMKSILEARMELSLFEEEQILDFFIHYSGGCLRDLFMLVSEAAINALLEERSTIIEEDKLYAFHKLKKDYKSSIADALDANGKVDIPVATYYKVLSKLDKSKTKIIDNTREELNLRQNLSILSYNGTGWCDVHPIVKEILKERGEGS